MISLFFASNSFFAGSSASALFASVFFSPTAASSGFLVSGPVEYHLDVAGLEPGAKEGFDGRNCGLANEDLGTDLRFEGNARVCRSSVLGTMVGVVMSRAWWSGEKLSMKRRTNF
jgi:hypothetical protein